MYCNKCGKAVRFDDVYCSYCGNKLEHREEFGTESEEVIYNASLPINEEEKKENIAVKQPKLTIDNSEFVWNVHEFSTNTKKKREEVIVDWQKLKVYDASEEGLTEDADDTDTMSTVPTEKNLSSPKDDLTKIRSELNKDDLTKIHSELNDEAAEPANHHRTETSDRVVTIEDIQKDIEQENILFRRDTEKIDRFYTFNQKNEEFQKLLDQEYERVNHGRTSSDSDSSDTFPDNQCIEIDNNSARTENADDENYSEAIYDVRGFIKNPKSTDGEKPDEKPEHAAFAYDKIEDVKIESQSRQEKQGQQGHNQQGHNQQGHNQQGHNAENPSQLSMDIDNDKNDDRNATYSATYNYFEKADSHDIMDNETIIKRFDTRELEKDILGYYDDEPKENKPKKNTPHNIAATEKPQELDKCDILDTDIAAADIEEDEMSPDCEAMEEAMRIINELYGELPGNAADTEDNEEAPFVQVEEESPEEIEYAMSAKEPVPVVLEEDEKDEDIEEFFGIHESDLDENESPIENRGRRGKKKEIQDDEYEYVFEEEGSSLKSKIFTGLIILIIIILAFEILFLGMRYFAPDSSITKAMENGASKILSVFTSGDNGDENDDKNTDPDNNNEQDSQDGQSQSGDNTTIPLEAEPLSLEELVFNAHKVNKNILKIEGDATIGYSTNTNSEKASELAKTVPIENNLWYVDENGNSVLIDQSVVNTLVAFDSQWIDYVNNKNESVFALLKEDGNAYKNCKAFKKAGLVKKEFTSLKIGEVRVGVNGYYIWAVEEIETTENGKTTSNTFRWIYCMEPIGQEIKIVDYYKF